MNDLLYLEPVGGIAGDMFLAAAVDLGVPVGDIARALSGLAVPTFELRASRATKHTVAGTHVDVVVAGAPTGHFHRGLSEILKLIDAASSMPARARDRARATFRNLGDAEAHVHGIPVEQVHFHEVGAVDSIVDICGAAVVLELLGNPEVFCAPPPLGSGTVQTEHGPLPIPPPATLELLREVPVRFEGIGELTTPTGAALVKTLCRVGPPPAMTVSKVGYGAGTRDFQDRANVLRATLGRRTAAFATDSSQTVVVEANLDDCSPQWLAHLVERVLELGALDAWVAPVTMKKGRPGHLLGVLADASKRPEVVSVLLRESTTLGVRFHAVDRQILERSFREVQTLYGPVRVKLGMDGAEVLNAQPEYEDCKARAAVHGVPLKQVWAAALTRYTLESGKPEKL